MDLENSEARSVPFQNITGRTSESRVDVLKDTSNVNRQDLHLGCCRRLERRHRSENHSKNNGENIILSLRRRVSDDNGSRLIMMLINVWWTVIALILPLCSVNSEPTCLENNVNVAPTKVFYVGRDLNITIEVSNRVTHKLVSQILIILLKEVLGYADVRLVSTEGGNSISTLQQISGCKIPEKCPEKSKNFVPNIMINVEVWLGPGNSTEKWVQTGNVADCGPLGPIGRTGWYLSLSFVHKLWQENNTILDHWRAFQKEEISSLFDISEKELKRYAFYNNKKYYCQFPECENSYYKPPQCRRPNVICATLLSDYSGNAHCFN
ncbi:uncharacterized protein LOC111620654 [Centruroides sculpturatus]|uniref:uncharacterized protein LOC111620654 n=1 Tax=Centruroides sculpturatus TaxID=218467 RepID=UPI000C6E75CD|nr:uncharacterized protein LOC111620654 [Centruroides sculpturatus]